MKQSHKLLAIGFAAPAMAHVVAAIVISPLLFLFGVLGYPIMVVATFLLLVPLHLLFVRLRVPPLLQLPFVLPCAVVGGLIVHVLLFHPAVLLNPMHFHFGLVSVRLATEYASFGVLAGFSCWVLYNWGPFHIATAPANPLLNTDARQETPRAG